MSGLSDFFFGSTVGDEVGDESVVVEDTLPEPPELQQTTDPHLSKQYASARKIRNDLQARVSRRNLKTSPQRTNNLTIVGPTDEEQMV